MIRQYYSPFPLFPVSPFSPYGYYYPYFYSPFYPYGGGYQYQQQPSTIVTGSSSVPPISVPLHGQFVH